MNAPILYYSAQSANVIARVVNNHDALVSHTYIRTCNTVNYNARALHVHSALTLVFLHVHSAAALMQCTLFKYTKLIQCMHNFITNKNRSIHNVMYKNKLIQ